MKAYVATPYTDKDGEHAIGEEVEFSRESEEDKINFDTLMRYGIIASTPAGAEKAAEGTAKPKR